MKLTEFPEREEEMKNYSSARRNLYIFIVLSLIILVGAIFAFPKSDLPVAIVATLLVTGVTAVAVIDRVCHELSRIPNGRPRPEDELQRKTVFDVQDRSHQILRIAPESGTRLIFWEFENLPKEVEAGKKVVYLDDLEGEYLATWKEQGVIPILSAEGRAKLDAKEAEHTEARNRFSEAMS